MVEARTPVPSRRWEYLYRLLDFAGAAIVEHADVVRRREQARVTESPLLHNFAWEEREAAAPEALDVADRAARAWCELFDRWWATADAAGCRAFAFPDVYALGFFLGVLHCDDAVYFRGQRNAAWQLETKLSRVAREGAERLRESSERATAFQEQLRRDPSLRRYYDGGDPLSEHLVAAAQHYGFPTRFLDFTTEFEVAAYFAEGGSDDVAPAQETPPVPCGAIYAVPAAALPLESTRLVALPPGFQRPRLQRGVFLDVDPERIDLQSFEAAKYLFLHAPFPLRRSIGNLRWGKSPGLSEFYFPIRDPFAQLAGEDDDAALRKRWHSQWLRDTYDLCFFDRADQRMWANDHHLRLRCKCEPVLAVRSFEAFIQALEVEPSDIAQPRNSGMAFFLRCVAKALLHEGVTPVRMRQRIAALVEARDWLRELPERNAGA